MIEFQIDEDLNSLYIKISETENKIELTKSSKNGDLLFDFTNEILVGIEFVVLDKLISDLVLEKKYIINKNKHKLEIVLNSNFTNFDDSINGIKIFYDDKNVLCKIEITLAQI